MPGNTVLTRVDTNVPWETGRVTDAPRDDGGSGAVYVLLRSRS